MSVNYRDPSTGNLIRLDGYTIDSVPTQDSGKPVSSGGVYDGLQEIKLSISNLSASVIHPSDVTNVVEDDNMNPVTSNAVYDEAQEIKLSISNLSASVLHTSGNETATGVKTFSSGINSSKGVIGPKASGESDPHVPLELRGSDTEAWVLFSNRLGVGLGYFGTTNDNKPYFYNTSAKRLAFFNEQHNWTLLSEVTWDSSQWSSSHLWNTLTVNSADIVNKDVKVAIILQQSYFNGLDTAYRNYIRYIDLPNLNGDFFNLTNYVDADTSGGVDAFYEFPFGILDSNNPLRSHVSLTAERWDTSSTSTKFILGLGKDVVSFGDDGISYAKLKIYTK